MREYNDFSIGSLREAAGHALLAIVGATVGAALVIVLLFYLAVTAPTTV